jgi:transposase
MEDLADIRRKLEQLASNGRTDELIEIVLALLARARETNTALAVRLQNALRALYGRKSAKVGVDQLALLFAELGKDLAPAGSDATESPPSEAAESHKPDASGEVPQPPEPPKPPRGRGGRSPLPPNLPRQEQIVQLPEAARTCSQCGANKTCIGHVESEVLEFVPAQFCVIVEKREKLVCPTCVEEGVVTAPSEKVMDRGRPGPGLLAHITVKKSQDSMPLYRQTQEYERYGVSLSPSTLGDWSAFALDVMRPVADRIAVHVVRSGYIRGDDTGLKVLDRDHPEGVKRGHVWAFVGAGLVAFHYAPNWKAEHPAGFLRDFKGYLQGDGYAGYAAMLRDDDTGELVVPDARRLGCGMHIRAKFESATKTGDARAAVAIRYFQNLYRVEASCKNEGLSAEQRKARRDELSLPVVDELYAWIHELHLRLVPKSPIFVATQYAINQEDAWRRCFTDGRFEIDNGEVERQLRRVATGRKNYLFAGSDKGAERLAVAYTVFGSCHMHGVDPWAWATDVIRKLQSGWPMSRLDELLPNVWAKRKPDDAPIHSAA